MADTNVNKPQQGQSSQQPATKQGQSGSPDRDFNRQAGSNQGQTGQDRNKDVGSSRVDKDIDMDDDDDGGAI